jgi:hypothetical protein
MTSRKSILKPQRFERLDLILEILKNGDHLETSVIAERLANRFKENVEDPAFRRSVHRDLQELNRRDEVNVDFYDRNGCLIEDYDNTDTKNIRRNLVCRWFINDVKQDFEGKKLLDSRHVSFWVPELLFEGIKVISGDSMPNKEHKAFYFLVSNQYLRIEIHQEFLPFTLLISRQTDEIRQSEKDFIAKKSSNHNYGILKIPYPELSAYKNQEKPGHALVKFINEIEVQIQDFESSNGSFAFPSPLTPEQVKKTIESHNMSKTLKKLDKHPEKPEKIENKHFATLPALFEFGVDLFLIV